MNAGPSDKGQGVEGAALVCTIAGMDCPDCAAKLEKVVARLSGVGEVRVDFPGQSLTAQVKAAPKEETP